jgi:hypothetical protein
METYRYANLLFLLMNAGSKSCGTAQEIAYGAWSRRVRAIRRVETLFKEPEGEINIGHHARQ